MKKNNRDSFRTPLGDGGNAGLDDVVLADLRAFRDEGGGVSENSGQDDEVDAIDRLLANSGFAKPSALPDKQAVPPLTASDDFEPDRLDAFRVEPCGQDGHLQVEPLMASGKDGHGSVLRATRDEGQDLFGHDAHLQVQPLEEPEPDGYGLALRAIRDGGQEPPQAVAHLPEPPVDDTMFAQAVAGDEDATGPLGLRKEPSMGVFSEPLPASGLDSPLEGLDKRGGDDNVFWRYGMPEGGGAPLPGCAYKHGQARINLITLVLSIIASLSAIALYFMLMDMRGDLARLNEMVDVMKDDIQMGRGAEPPAE